jgi:WD40 repeat protein/predicted Ser/Thr protein kinase
VAATSPTGIEGRTLGDFVVVERLGEGGFGVVYRAEQRLLGRDAVIKVLHERHRERPDTIQRFLREAKLASRLDHPYAAHVYAFGAEPDGLLWIAMERVRGEPLDAWLRAHGKVPLDELVPFLERLCEVVHTAHEQGIVHRDIKPANIMVLARAGRLLPKLLDFGVAKAIGDAAPAAEREAGRRIGSPLYMAPELWTEAAAADARSDLYALAITAYEALTGQPPFAGGSLRALALAHAELTPPAIGDRFPPALDPVFARALAKAPGERFPSVLELGAAFRAGSGVVDAGAALPRLPEALRDEAIAAAPQPIAEAIDVLDGARSAHQAIDAAWQAVAAVVRYLALAALAARTRTADPVGHETAELLRALRRRTLADDEWVRLLRALAAPHRDRADAHPVPALITAAAAAEPALDALLALRPRVAHAGGASDLAARDLLVEVLAPVEALVRALAPVFAYTVVVARGGVAERWRGLRRPRRRPCAALPILADGDVALVDATGRGALRLSPLIAAAAPVPGAPPELFFLDGSDLRGARFVAFPAGFERHDDAVWEWLRGHVPDLDAGAATTSDDERAPYRGLAAFTRDDAGAFFGREDETGAFVNRLRIQPFAAVVGPSGAGKSSFVQAGVIPALPAGWRAVTVRPGAAPIAALAARLRAAGVGGDEVEPAIAADPDALGAVLRADADARGPVLLVVDQLEELFTLCADPDERVRYADAVAGAARSADDPVRVVVTLRDDFLVRAEQLPALRNRIAQALQLLAAPTPDDLTRIVVEPARRAGYELEDAALARTIVDAVADQPSALALVSFTMARLWELRDRHFRQLLRKDYVALGGVGGALAQHAERTLAAMPADHRRLARAAFRNLVTSEGTRAVLSRAEVRQLLGEPAAADAVLEALIGARLLTAGEDPAGGGDTIEIVHEALIAAWPRLAEWRRDDAESARLRDQLRAAARQWGERGRPDGLLWRGEALAELVRWRARDPGAVTDAEVAFVAASSRAATRGRRIRTGLVVGAFAALAAGVAVLLVVNAAKETERRRAEASEQVARGQVVELYEEQGRQLFLSGDPIRAAVYLDAAARAGGASPGLRYLMGRTASILAKRRFELYGHAGLVWDGRYTPDGRELITIGEDGTARIWDAATGTARARLAGHDGRINSIELDARGARMISGGEDGTARVWNVASGELVATIADHGNWVVVARLDATGGRALTAALPAPGSADFAARLSDAATGAPIASLRGHRGRVVDVAFARGAAFTAGEDGTVLRWDAASGAPRGVHATHPAPLAALATSADGARLASASTDGTVIVADAAGTRTIPAQMVIERLAFAPDGATLAIAGGSDVQLFAAATGRRIAALRGHAGAVSGIAFTGDGARVATASEDGNARIWDAATGQLLGLLPSLDALKWIAVAPGGAEIAFGGGAGAAVWDARNDVLVRTFALGEEAAALAFDAAGRQLAACGMKGAVRTWRLDGTPGLAVRYGDQDGDLCIPLFAGESLITVGERGIDRWDLRTGARLAELTPDVPSVFSIVLDPSATRAVSAHKDAARVWALDTGVLVHTLAHDATVYSVAWSRGGELIATCSRDGAVRFWDAATGATRGQFQLEGWCFSIGLDATARHAITASRKSARISTVPAGEHVRSFDGHQREVLGAMIAANGLVVTTSWDGTARVWDATTGRQLEVLAHPGQVGSGELGPDGTLAATLSGDRVYLWNLTPPVAPARLAAIASGLPLVIRDDALVPRP